MSRRQAAWELELEVGSYRGGHLTFEYPDRNGVTVPGVRIASCAARHRPCRSPAGESRRRACRHGLHVMNVAFRRQQRVELARASTVCSAWRPVASPALHPSHRPAARMWCRAACRDRRPPAPTRGGRAPALTNLPARREKTGRALLPRRDTGRTGRYLRPSRLPYPAARTHRAAIHRPARSRAKAGRSASTRAACWRIARDQPARLIDQRADLRHVHDEPEVGM